MECKIIQTVEQFDEACNDAAARGLRLACVSNAGLHDGVSRRLTFLPAEAFTVTEGTSEWKNSGPPRTKRKPMNVRDFIAGSE